MTSGLTVWLTGLPSAGKTTIARQAAAVLAHNGHQVEILDGDELRRSLCADLSFSRADRDANVARIGYVAQILARNAVVVLVPVIAPYAAARDGVRRWHLDHGTPFLEVFVDAPVEVCEERDVKGLYAEQRAGRIRGLTGIDDPYERPTRPDIHLTTANRTSSASTAELVAAVLSQLDAHRHEDEPSAALSDPSRGGAA